MRSDVWTQYGKRFRFQPVCFNSSRIATTVLPNTTCVLNIYRAYTICLLQLTDLQVHLSERQDELQSGTSSSTDKKGQLPLQKLQIPDFYTDLSSLLQVVSRFH